MRETQVERFIKNPESHRLFEQEQLILEVTERICETMDARKINKKGLSDLLKTSKGYITQLLDGSSNLTLRKMADVFFMLGVRVRIETIPMQSSPRKSAMTMQMDNIDWPQSKPITWPAASPVQMDANHSNAQQYEMAA